MESWYPKTKLTQKQLKYIHLVQEIWNVFDADMNLVKYKLTPHQIHWHSNDIAILGNKAKDRVVVKSRNTSFTTSCLISNLMAIPKYPSQILPFVRLNQQRAFDLIEECKILIRNMTPILIKGKYYPFNPAEVELEKIGSIKFPNGVEFRAMPANASSAETIRGMRIFGSAGMIDESNFMMRFRSIYIALRDASRGSMTGGSKHFQMNIGTTRKGRMTDFNIWFEDILKNRPENIDVYWWPVLQHDKLNLDISLVEQYKELNLQTIVPWHTIKDLENKRKEDLNTFKEEYQAQLVDAEDSLYPYEIIQAAIDSELINQHEPTEGEQYTMGIDPAATSDLFSVSIFEINTKVQKFLHYSQKVPLKTMESFCDKLIKKWKPVKCRIDGNGLGYSIGQNLQHKYSSFVVEVLRGAVSIRVPSKVTGNVPLKEFLHTNQIRMMNYNEIKLIEDEMQIKHYLSWKNDYSCLHDSSLGHGDIVISNGLALLPLKWRFAKRGALAIVREKDEKLDINLNEENINEEIKW